MKARRTSGTFLESGQEMLVSQLGGKGREEDRFQGHAVGYSPNTAERLCACILGRGAQSKRGSEVISYSAGSSTPHPGH